MSSLLAAFPPLGTTGRREVAGATEADQALGHKGLGHIVLVVSNVAGAPVLEKAAAAGVPTLEVPWRGRAAFEAAAIELANTAVFGGVEVYGPPEE